MLNQGDFTDARVVQAIISDAENLIFEKNDLEKTSALEKKIPNLKIN